MQTDLPAALFSRLKSHRDILGEYEKMDQTQHPPHHKHLERIMLILQKTKLFLVYYSVKERADLTIDAL